MNYYERHLGDYARDTAHLSILEHGVYTLLLDRYYATEQGIPAEQAHRVARARSKDERDAVDAVLAEFFHLRDGTWINNRVTEELAKAAARIKAAQENGRRGGRPKKPAETQQKPSGFAVVGEKETEEKPSGFSLGSDSETQQKAHQSPDTRHQAKAEKQKTLARQAARFAEFWSEYPVKKGRAEALAKWTARNLDAIADQIISDVKARKVLDRQWLDGFAPHGSTYVNGRGWEDEIEVARKPADSSGGGHDGVFGVAL